MTAFIQRRLSTAKSFDRLWAKIFPRLNVRVVASNVGREPIRYVGNIYEYYLAHHRQRDIERERDCAMWLTPRAL